MVDGFGLLDPERIPKLVKLLDKIARRRHHELERINRVFNTEPRSLARRYVEPSVQFRNPVDTVADGKSTRLSDQEGTLNYWMSRFLARDDQGDRSGEQVLFLLGDAGMGKTSAMVMLRLWHLTGFWPKSTKVRLMKLGPETLHEIDQIEDRSPTVLLLDALDEDPEAQGRVEERLIDLLRRTEAFRKVVISCRTQFFPRGGQHSLIEKERQVELGGYICNLLYLSPFDSGQIELYLRKAFPAWKYRWLTKWLPDREPESRKQARTLVESMRDLRMRPLILSYIDHLLDDTRFRNLERPPEVYEVFDALVGRWLLREERKIGRELDEQNPPKAWQLRSICRTLAHRMVSTGKPTISSELLENFLGMAARRYLKAIDVKGRSLLNKTSEGEFRFAHRTIQEFLVIEELAGQVRSQQAVERIEASDEMVGFYFSAVRCDPEFPNLTPILHVAGVEDLPSLIWPIDGTKPLASWRWLLPGSHIENLSLRGEDLSGLDLSGLDLSGADLSNAQLSETDLSHANLSHANLSGCQLEATRLESAFLEGVIWHRTLHGNIQLEFFHRVRTRIDGEVDVWRTIPAGECWIGSPNDEEGRSFREGPRHRVEILAPFQIMAVPVTNHMYAFFDPSKGDKARLNHPVVNVTWEEANAFCKWMAQLPGFEGARLPTEREWEYVCRAGTASRFWKGDTESDLAEVGWYKENSGGFAHAVGEKKANAWGLYDVHGNIWEWTATRYREERYLLHSVTEPLAIDPGAPGAGLSVSAGPRCVFRGGCYEVSADLARSAYRAPVGPWNRWESIGFRVLLPHPPAGR